MPRRTEITEIYVATFERAPDSGGLDYWERTTLSVDDIAESFFEQPETQEKYPDTLDNADFVNTIYLNLFNRDAEPGGLAYWVMELESGNITRAQMILSVVRGSLEKDAQILANKTAVGLDFADSGLENWKNSIDIMTDIDETQESVDAAFIQIDIWAELAETIHYTTEEDHIQATTEDDHIDGLINMAATGDLSTIQTIDTVDGRAGYDIVTIQNTSSIAGNTVLTMENVEVIDIQESGTVGASLRMEKVTGLKKIIYSEHNAATGEITNLNNIIDLEYNSDDVQSGKITINYKDEAVAGDEDTMNIAVNTTSAGQADIVTTNGIEIVNIKAVGNSNLEFNDVSTTIINISGDGTLELSSTTVNIKVNTIDASLNTGGITVDGSIVSTLEGSKITGSAAIDHIAGGDGVDHITGGLGADELAGGILADKFYYFNNLDSNGVSIDTIVDFSGSIGNGDGDQIIVTEASVGSTGNALTNSVAGSRGFVSDASLIVTDGGTMAKRGIYNPDTGYLYIDANDDGTYNVENDIMINLGIGTDVDAPDIIV
ncbi:MAG: hypothetical protein DRG30_03765 [Epsilonproteobacteria bacterium]|nr:MAG: hypothetical protein DRG30_03765 [Campylobacterota bacterium]